jgi:hypothetical protein
MLVEIDPVLIDQSNELEGRGISQLIISTRFKGYTLYPLTAWPSHVYIARILDETILRTLSFTKKQIELIAWGMLFRTLEEAEAHANRQGVHGRY